MSPFLEFVDGLLVLQLRTTNRWHGMAWTDQPIASKDQTTWCRGRASINGQQQQQQQAYKYIVIARFVGAE
jgi:hypothetical protein